MKKNKKAFTLIEIMITVVLIGIIATFAIPNYSKAIAKARERDAIIQLSAIHAAAEFYKARVGSYYSADLATAVAINNALKTNIIPNNITYSYAFISLSKSFEVTANCGTFSVKILSGPLGQGISSNNNPCCVGTNCPSYPSLFQC